MQKTISIIGLGKLGLPFMACFAARGFRIIGVDIDIDKICKTSWRTFRIVEPEIEKMLREYSHNYLVTNKLYPAVMDSEITLILVPTPSDVAGAFSTKFVLDVCGEISEALKKKTDFHIVAILSTVMPGSMAKIKDYLEDHTGKKCGQHFGLCYSPELVAIGDIVKTFLNPDLIMIGESDAKSGNILAEVYRRLCSNNPPIQRSNFVNVELAKISVNAYITTKISFANSLAEICECIPEADASWISSTIGRDERIGQKYFKGALGYSGFCFPRDSRAFIHMAKEIGGGAPISEATDRVNDRQVKRIVEKVKVNLPPEGIVSILGIAFKPRTNTTEESQGLAIAQELGKSTPIGRSRRAGIPVYIYDPLEPENLIQILTENLVWTPSMDKCLEEGDVVVIANSCEEFKNLAPRNFKEGSTIIDCWSLLDKSKFGNQKRVKYLRVGTYANEY